MTDIITTNLDAGTDSPRLARAQLLEAVQKVNLLRNAFSSDTVLVNTSPSYAAIAINATRTTINRHAFEDWSALNTTDTNLGYASFDAMATMTNSLVQNHFVGYQARNIYNGNAGLNGYMYGFDAAMSHTGTGTIASFVGVNITDIAGTGPVTSDVGLHIGAITRGSSNYSIYTEAGKVHFDGPMELASSATNHAIRQGAAWTWTSDATTAGTLRGGIYADSAGGLNLWGGSTIASTLYITPAGVTVNGTFSCNGAASRARAAVNAASTDLATAIALLNQIRTALINNGICV